MRRLGKTRVRVSDMMMVVAVAASFAGCIETTNPGNGSGRGTPSPVLQPPLVDLNGSWTVTETIVSGDCDDLGVRSTYSVDIAQAGNDLVVSAPGGTLSGTISGRTIDVSGRQSEVDGVSETFWTNIEVALDGNSVSGAAAFVFTSSFFPEDNCDGATSIFATRD